MFVTTAKCYPLYINEFLIFDLKVVKVFVETQLFPAVFENVIFSGCSFPWLACEFTCGDVHVGGVGLLRPGRGARPCRLLLAPVGAVALLASAVVAAVRGLLLSLAAGPAPVTAQLLENDRQNLITMSGDMAGAWGIRGFGSRRN